jgi:N-acetylmuramoyl-L-alanine amidase
MRNIELIIIHCSATPEGRDVTTDEIRSWHLDRGWSDIGYHFVVELDGSVNDGRPLEISGAHAKGHNSNSIGICYVGGLDESGEPKDTRTPEQEKALVELLENLKDQYPEAQIIGHRDVSDKDCPCFDASEEYMNI